MEATAERAERLAAGAIGEPAQVMGWTTRPLLEINDDPGQWRLNPDLAGEGGSITDLGIYPINNADVDV
jgi:xylose dehydrogenase (NAD/NADP)